MVRRDSRRVNRQVEAWLTLEEAASPSRVEEHRVRRAARAGRDLRH
jgi:hypothetical protein